MPADPANVPSSLVRVAIDAPLRQLFDYVLPQVPDPSALCGMRVRVPFGKRHVVGIVVEPAAPTAVSNRTLKDVEQVLDPDPVFDPALLRLLRWTADYYHHPLGEVMAAALPTAIREGAPLRQMTRVWKLAPGLEPGDVLAGLRRSPRQFSLAQSLSAADGGLSEQVLSQAQPGWRAAARALRERGYVECVEQPVTQLVAEAHDGAADAADLVLAPAQQTAVERISASLGQFQSFVLHGVTGSGKTEVYLRCAATALARGQNVLVLVPEIALTPQLVTRFQRQLRVPMSILHSGLSDAERLQAWRRAHSGIARVVLGTRSAVFAPLRNLGLIVVDEEHDSSYKQTEGGLRYHARDVALVRGQHAAAPVILGSATPAFETLLNAERGRFVTLQLPRRDDQAIAPAIALIDLRSQAVRQGLSTALVEAIKRHLQAGGQVLVYINRRGFAPTLLCTACGWIAPCSECDARLTVHQASQTLRCHHCGASHALPPRCPRCGHGVKPVGQGTERVEETLRELFPETTLLRLDRDTASDAARTEHIVAQVRDGRARILVGTQMVTKGHHFPAMSLVAILNADQGLFSTDFRAAERLAQTIVQVAGRAGREQDRGEVMIQTEYPDHPLLQNLVSAGYSGFASAAMIERAAARWPPFTHLAVLRASAPEPGPLNAFLEQARDQAHPPRSVQLLGPVAAAMARRAGRRHAHLLMESQERASLHRFIDASLPHFEALARQYRVRYALDVDPLEIQ